MADTFLRSGSRRVFLGLALALGIASIAQACGEGAFQQKEDPENLKALFEKLSRTVNVEKNPEAARQMLLQLVPDDRRLKAALREDLPEESFKILSDLHSKVAKHIGSEEFAPLKSAPAKAPEVRVYSATTEEMIENKKDSVTYSKFPNGALRTAERALPPGKRFYVVHYCEPGKADSARDYELLYWDGEQWTLLLNVYAILPEYAPKKAN